MTGTPANAGVLQPSGWQDAKVAVADIVGNADALSCVTPSWCLTVGSGGTQIWDGQQWTSASTGKLNFHITALSCYSRWDCMVVGWQQVDVGATSYSAPAVMHWDGISWNLLSPTIQLPDEDAFAGVSCPAVKTCFVTGRLLNRVLLWQNGVWTSQPLAVPDGGTSVNVADIDCPAVDSCHAVGWVRFPTTPTYAYGSSAMASWDGTAWSTELVPSDGHGDVALGSISCPEANSCVAVGSDNDRMIGDVWNGMTWQASPVPDSPYEYDTGEQEIGPYEALNGISCWSADHCQAIGVTDTAHFHRLWNGHTWTVLDDSPLTTDLSSLSGSSDDEKDVDCVYAAFCLAVGSHMERYNP